MPTALEVHSALRDFLAGDDPGVAYRAGPEDTQFRIRYNGHNIVGPKPSGSQNYGPMAGANDLVYHYHRKDWGDVNRILDAWAEYAKLNWLTTEVYSCNIYRAFITLAVVAASNVAEMRGRHELAAALRKHPRTGAVLTALASGWKKNQGGFKGYPCMVTGGRSFSGNINYELTGNTFGSSEFAYWAALSQAPENSMEAAIQRFAGKQNIWGATAQERSTLREIVHNRLTPERLAACVEWLRDGPGFAADAAIIRTDEMVAFVTFNSVNVGSTNWLPGKAWYANGAPANANRWGIDPEWGVCTVDFPARVWGGRIAGEILDGYTLYRAQRITVHKKRQGRYEPYSWYNEKINQHVDGWAEMDLKGNLKLDLRVGRSGVSVVYPDGEPPPPPPPPPGKIDMLELIAPSSVDHATTSEVGGIMTTHRYDESRTFVLVKYASGKAWDWFYWDDNYIYHFMTGSGDPDDATAFTTHAAPGVKWCKRFATLGEVLTSSPQIFLWRGCEQGPAGTLASASTKLHDRAYTGGGLGMASGDLPASTVCYRLDWRWGENGGSVETFTYAVGWGFLDWDFGGYSTSAFNLLTPRAPVEPIFPCFDVPDWVDENMRPDDPPPPDGDIPGLEPATNAILKAARSGLGTRDLMKDEDYLLWMERWFEAWK